MRSLTSLAAILLLSSVAHADRVHLKDGAMLEGRASRVGDRVVIEIESGAVTVEASEVRLIESAESPLDYVVARRATLRDSDVQGRIALVRYCRDHGLSAHEAELLREVLDLAPDNAEARAALGYVKHEGEWMTRDDAMLAQGYVKHDGQWITREERLALERLEADEKLAELQREKAELELQAVRAQADASSREVSATNDASARSVTYFTPFSYWHHDHDHDRSHLHAQRRAQPVAPRAPERARPEKPRKPVAAKVGARDPRVR